jgi:hypothetical protein
MSDGRILEIPHRHQTVVARIENVDKPYITIKAKKLGSSVQYQDMTLYVDHIVSVE